MDEQQLENEIFLWINRMEESILEETNDPDASRIMRINEIDCEYPEWQEQHELRWKQLIESGKPILTFEAYMEAIDDTAFLRRIYDESEWHESLMLHFMKGGYVLPPEPRLSFWYTAEIISSQDKSAYYEFLDYMYMRINYNFNLFEKKFTLAPIGSIESELFWDNYIFELEYDSDPGPNNDL